MRHIKQHSLLSQSLERKKERNKQTNKETKKLRNKETKKERKNKKQKEETELYILGLLSCPKLGLTSHETHLAS